MTRLPRWLRRVAALSILAGLLGTVWLAVGQPLYDRYHSERLQIADDLALIERYQQMIAERPLWEAELEGLASRSGAGAYLVQADNPAIAGAQIQNEIKRTAAVGRATVRSLQVLPARDAGPFLEIGVRATMTLPMEGISTVLYQLEATGRPYRIRQLSIRGHDIPGRAGQASAQVGVLLNRPLEVRFDLFALMRKPEGAGGGA